MKLGFSGMAPIVALGVIRHSKYSLVHKLKILFRPTNKTPNRYLTWVSNLVLMASVLLTSFNIYPLGVILLCIGSVGWLYAAFIYRDRAMIFIESFYIVVAVVGVILTSLNILSI